MIALPVETWSEVFQWLSFQEHRALCHVSKVFYAIAVCRLYRIIMLDGSFFSVKQCYTVMHNDHVATPVQSVHVSFRTLNRSLVLRAYLRLAVRILRRTINVSQFFVFIGIPAYSDPVINCLTFPRLRAFIHLEPFNHSTSSFLRRHPNLEQLMLNSSFTPESTFDHYSLPRLEQFFGPAFLVVCLVPGAPVHTVSLEGTIAEVLTDLPSVVEALAKSTVPIISIDVTLFDGWSMDLLDSLSKSFPSLLSLTLFAVFDPEEISDPVIPRSLSRTRQLRTFGLTSSIIVDADLNVQSRLAVLWGSACPSLEWCTFPDGAKWRRRGKQIWLPSPHHEYFETWLNQILADKTTELREMFPAGLEELYNRDRLTEDEEQLFDDLFLPNTKP